MRANEARNMAEKTRERSDGKSGARNGRGAEDLALQQVELPQDLQTCEEVAPGSAEKFVEMYISERAHRRDLEARREHSRAWFDAFVLAVLAVVVLAVFGASTWLITKGQAALPGTILGIIDLVGVFLMLIFRRERA
jgi:uncharacterized membrane protein